MVKFIHAADIHLDSPLIGLSVHEDAPVDNIRGATRRALENLVQLAIEEEVSFILIVGDLFDGNWRDYKTGLYFVRQMSLLDKAGIRVFIVSGNHDAQSQLTKTLKYPPNVHIFSTRKAETVQLENLETAIHGRGFSSREVTENMVPQYPDPIAGVFNIGLLHTSLAGNNQHDTYAPCTVGDLFAKGYQYWALGHIHKREEVHKDPWIIYPGNIQGRHIREEGNKGCTLVEVENGEVASVQHRDLDVLRWHICRVDLKEVQKDDEVISRCRTVLQDALEASEGRPIATRIILEGISDMHRILSARRSYWINQILAVGIGVDPDDIWVEKVVFNTRPAINIEEMLAGNDALAELLKVVRESTTDTDSLKPYLQEISALRSKIPHEIFDNGGLDPLASESLNAAISVAEDILLAKLLDVGAEEDV